MRTSAGGEPEAKLEFEIMHEPKLALRAANWFLVDHFGIARALLMGAMFALAVTGVVIAGTPVTWILLGVQLMLLAFILFAWAVRRKVALAFFKRCPDRTVRYSVSDEAFGYASALGSGSIKWSTFVGLKKHRDFYLLMLTAGSYLMLPTSAAPPEALARIEEHLPLMRKGRGRSGRTPST